MALLEPRGSDRRLDIDGTVEAELALASTASSLSSSLVVRRGLDNERPASSTSAGGDGRRGDGIRLGGEENRCLVECQIVSQWLHRVHTRDTKNSTWETPSPWVNISESGWESGQATSIVERHIHLIHSAQIFP